MRYLFRHPPLVGTLVIVAGMALGMLWLHGAANRADTAPAFAPVTQLQGQRAAAMAELPSLLTALSRSNDEAVADSAQRLSAIADAAITAAGEDDPVAQPWKALAESTTHLVGATDWRSAYEATVTAIDRLPATS